MRYFVISDDGQKYGPADIATLNTWIAEGRLLPTQQLEDEASGVRMAASAVQGLNFPPAGAQGPAGVASPYAGGASPYQTGRISGNDGNEGSGPLMWSWICSILGFICCPVILSIVGLCLAISAKNKGNSKAQAALIFAIVAIVLQIILFAVRFNAAMDMIQKMGAKPH